MKAAWVGYLNTPDTFWSDVKYLSNLGYKALEGGDSLLGSDVKDNLARLNDLGLSVLTVGASMWDLRKDQYKDVIENAKALNSPNATVFACNVNASFSGQVADYDECMKDIECLEVMSGRFAEEGIQLCYHNHFQDFTVSFGCVKFLDLLIHGTEQLKFEIDIGWAQNGGEDPVRLIQRLAPRIQMLHVKDYLSGAARADGSGFDPIFTSVGTGELRLREVMRAAAECGIEWAVAEQDTMRNLNPLNSLTCAYLNMKETGHIQ